MTRYAKIKTIAWLSGFLLCIAAIFSVGGCTKGPYKYRDIEAYTIIGDDLYLLFREEVGVNAQPILTDGNGFHAEGVSLVLAHCSLNQPGKSVPQIVGSLHIDHKKYWATSIFSICSTNNIFVMATYGLYDVMSFNNNSQIDFSQWLRANSIVFNTGHSLVYGLGTKPGEGLIYGSGTKPWILESATLRPAPKKLSESLTVFNSIIGKEWCKKGVISSDTKTMAFQQSEPLPMHVTIVSIGNGAKTNDVDLKKEEYSEIHAISGKENGTKLLLTGIVGNLDNLSSLKSIAAIVDGAGKELGRIENDGQCVANSDLSKVAFFPKFFDTKNYKGELLITVWLPNENRSFQINTSLKGIERELDDALKK